MFRIELHPWLAARALATSIRFKVFVEEQRVPVEIELDAQDETSLHALAWTAQNDLVGTGRLLAAEGDGDRRVSHLGRMAVLAPWRGRGAGSAILRALVDAARARGDAQVVLAAQVHALGFYRAHHFVEEGAEFLEAGIAHRLMRRALRG
ncbi:MAG: GNAT family N-acetyltransferase [Burkholderiales bacterium]|nr:GNAT family N-acetyltransferase [Burkholderiales bacterium]